MVIAVMVVVANDAVVIVAVTGPLIWLHAPVPLAAVLPAMVAEPAVAQIVWSLPAVAVVGSAFTVMITSSGEAVHGLLLMVQRRVYIPAPPMGVKTVLFTAVLANWLVEVDGPDTTDQTPMPFVGTFAASVTAGLLMQLFWSGPATEAVVPGMETMETSSVVAVHGLLLMVQRNT